MGKYRMVSELAKHTAEEVSRTSENWKHYLNTASRIYKYPFQEQILIYAQRPDAQACASMEIWNSSMHCWVNKGAKGIALLDKNSISGLKYVFDISDVHKARRIGKFPYLWEMQEVHKEAIQQHLESIYGKNGNNADFIDYIFELSQRIAEDSLEETAQSMATIKKGSVLEDLEEETLQLHIQQTIADSIAYMVLKRCGVSDEVLAEEIQFPYISEFDTLDTLSQLGATLSEQSKYILIEIGKAIRLYERENALKKEEKEERGELSDTNKKNAEKGLANASETNYNALTHESDTGDKESIMQTEKDGERGNYDEIGLRTERGLSDSDAQSRQRTGGNIDEVWTKEREVSDGTQKGDLRRASVRGQAESSLTGDAGAGRGTHGSIDHTDDEGTERDRRTQREESDALGTEDEQHPSLSRGNRAEGIDLQLNSEPIGGYEQLSLFPNFEEQIGIITATEADISYVMPVAFLLEQEQIDTILRSGGGRNDSRKRIYVLINPKREFMLSDNSSSQLSATLVGLSMDIGMVGLPMCFIVKNNYMRFSFLLLFVFSLFTTFSLLNRTGLVVALLCFIIVIGYRSRHDIKALMLSLLGVGVIFGLLFYFDIINTELIDFYSERNEDLLTMGTRTERWSTALGYLFTRPLGWAINGQTYYIHNMWLDVARISGIIPFSLLAYIAYDSFRKAFRLIKKYESPLAYMILGLNVCFFASCFVEPIYGGTHMMLYCMLWGTSTKLLTNNFIQR